MYSAVLMMALTTGGETTAHHRNHGCAGVPTCATCNAPCTSCASNAPCASCGSATVAPATGCASCGSGLGCAVCGPWMPGGCLGGFIGPAGMIQITPTPPGGLAYDTPPPPPVLKKEEVVPAPEKKEPIAPPKIEEKKIEEKKTGAAQTILPSQANAGSDIQLIATRSTPAPTYAVSRVRYGANR